MKIVDLGVSIKWQESDKRSVTDIRKEVLDKINFPEGSMLEVGCADGNFFKFLPSDRVDSYVGVDVDNSQIKMARKYFPNADFRHGNILNSKFDDLIKSSKSIVSFQVLEHIQYDIKLLEKINPGTLFVFSVPNFPFRGASPTGHKRYFEMDGWIKRYDGFLNISEVWTVHHYFKNRKIFVFKSVRELP